MADGDFEIDKEVEIEIKPDFDFLSVVKILLGVSDDSLDGILQIYLSMTKDSILNYCNIKELPSALNYTLCRMTADVYCDVKSKTKVGSSMNNISSISEDGRTVSFSTSADMLTSIEDRISRTNELNRYRKLYRI